MTAVNPSVSGSLGAAPSASSKKSLSPSQKPSHVGVKSITAQLSELGIQPSGQVHHNLSVAELVERALQQREGQLASNGALCVETGKYTGRSPHDRFIVDEPAIHAEIDWNAHNRPISETSFERLYQRLLDYVQGRELYVLMALLEPIPTIGLGYG
jgi:phosphoenolpyruvate carboxykinase (ATP)